MQWEDAERRWLGLLLDPNRKPSSDPGWELMLSLGHLIGSRRGAGEPPVELIRMHPNAWDVILRSASILPSPSGNQVHVPCTSLMGIPVEVDDRMLRGAIAFLDSSGDLIRLVLLE